MYRVRGYKHTDYELIHSWWTQANEVAPLRTMLPPDSTFVLEVDNTPKMAVTVYLTNTVEFAMVDNYIRDPKFRDKKGGQYIVAFIEEYARRLGYRRLFCMAHKDKTAARYQELGYRPTLTGVTTMVKEL